MFMIYIVSLLLLCSPILCVGPMLESEQRQSHGTLSPLKVAMQLYRQQETILDEVMWCTPNADGSYDIHQPASIKILSTNDIWHPRVAIRKITPSNYMTAIMVEYSISQLNENPPITSYLSLFLNIPYTKSLPSDTNFYLLATRASIHQ